MSGSEGAIDPRRLADLHDRVRDLVDRIHRVSGWIALGTFCAYGLAAWIGFQGRPWMAVTLATVAFLIFRRFRMLSLGLVRHWAGVQPEYREAMAFVDEAVERLGPSRALAEIAARLHQPPQRPPAD